MCIRDRWTAARTPGARCGSWAWTASGATSWAVTPAARWVAANPVSARAPASPRATTRPPFASYSHRSASPAPSSSPSSANSRGQRADEARARVSSGPGGLSETSRLPSPWAVVPEASGARSSTVTRTPRRVSASAQAAPMMPLPTTATSGYGARGGAHGVPCRTAGLAWTCRYRMNPHHRSASRVCVKGPLVRAPRRYCRLPERSTPPAGRAGRWRPRRTGGGVVP